MSLSFDVLGIGLNATDTLILVKEFPAYAGKVPFGRELVSPGGQVATAVVRAPASDSEPNTLVRSVTIFAARSSARAWRI